MIEDFSSQINKNKQNKYFNEIKFYQKLLDKAIKVSNE